MPTLFVFEVVILGFHKIALDLCTCLQIVVWDVIFLVSDIIFFRFAFIFLLIIIEFLIEFPHFVTWAILRLFIITIFFLFPLFIVIFLSVAVTFT